MQIVTSFLAGLLLLLLMMTMMTANANPVAVGGKVGPHGGGFTSTVGAQEPGDNTW